MTHCGIHHLFHEKVLFRARFAHFVAFILLHCGSTASHQMLSKYITAAFLSNQDNASVQYSSQYLQGELSKAVKHNLKLVIPDVLHAMWNVIFRRMKISGISKYLFNTSKTLVNVFCISGKMKPPRLDNSAKSSPILIHYFQLSPLLKLNVTFINFHLSSALQCWTYRFLYSVEIRLPTKNTEYLKIKNDAGTVFLCGRLPIHTRVLSSSKTEISIKIQYLLHSHVVLIYQIMDVHVVDFYDIDNAFDIHHQYKNTFQTEVKLLGMGKAIAKKQEVLVYRLLAQRIYLYTITTSFPRNFLLFDGPGLNCKEIHSQTDKRNAG